MTDIQIRILGLMRYAYPATLFDESVSTGVARETYAAATAAAGFEPPGFGLSISYRGRDPEHLTVIKSSLASTAETRHRVALTGDLAVIFEREMMAVAQARMREQIRKEREAALDAEARLRLVQMLDPLVSHVANECLNG